MNACIPTGRRQHGGLLTKMLLGFALLFAVGAMLWIVLLPSIVVTTIRSRTGFAVKVEQLSANPFTGKVTIKGLVLKNPADWPVEEFVDLREFHAEANLFSLLGSRIVVDEMVVDVAQVTLVKNQQGKVNALAFKAGLAGKDAPASAASGQGGAQPGFLIRHLVLRFDKLVYADCSGGRPKTKDYSLNISREMRDVDSVAKIVSPFTGSALGMITGTLSGKFPVNPDVLGDLKASLQDAGKKTGEKLKSLLDSLDKKRP